MQDDLERAVGHVLPALNLDPSGFSLPGGFLRRARFRGSSVLALNGMARQLVYLDSVAGAAPTGAGERAVELLGPHVREVCEQLVVAWSGDSGEMSAAAFGMSSAGELGPLLATSWEAPDRWPVPTIDYAGSGPRVIDDALARVQAAVAGRRAGDFDLDQATRLVDLELRRRGGEGQAVQARPAPDADDDTWRTWLARYTSSVRSEWRRVGGERDPEPEVAVPTARGPLTGTRVFLSYARPDATTLAWPVREALGEAGAAVWFDQEEDPDPARLDAGLGDAIASCDAYVMCASDEFVERAGYATQEIAWAAQQSSRLRVLVATTPNVVLPTLVLGWPRVEVTDDSAELGHRLVEALTAPRAILPELPPRAASADPTDLPCQADVQTMRLRAAHSRRFDEIDHETFEAITGRDVADRRAAAVRARLIDVGDGLGWSGTLADLDSWPDDSFVRDYRLRLASMRVAASTRWPLNQDAGSPTPVAGDLEVLVTRRTPLIDWPSQAGWADNERRFALRFLAGVLRVLEELLEQRLIGGVMGVPLPTLDAWAVEIRERRRECYDALVQMRLEGRLSWTAEPPHWDALLRAWTRVLSEAGVRWSGEDPPLLLRANADDIAAVGAQTAWCAARHGGLALQSFDLRSPGADTRVDVYAVGASGAPPPCPGAGRVQLGVGPGPSVTLRWEGGEASRPAPEELAHSVSRRSI